MAVAPPSAMRLFPVFDRPLFPVRAPAPDKMAPPIILFVAWL